MAPNHSQLLFINKDANNLSRTAQEIYAIGSHVSRGSRKCKRRKSNLDMDSSTGRILATTGFESPNAAEKRPKDNSRNVMVRWRAGDGKVTSIKTMLEVDQSFHEPRVVKSATTSPNPTIVPSPTMTPPANCPLSTVSEDHGRSVRSLFQFYFESIRPFALSISRAWLWVDNASVVLSSPALTYAICAYTSAFKTSIEHGLHTLVLPPDCADGTEPLWPVPDWFVFQAQAISLLRRHIATTSGSSRPVQKAELHAMLFLMRLQVLIGDRESALLHLNAIRMATENAAILPDLHVDMALWKINMMFAYMNRPKVVQQPYVCAEDPALQSPLFELDRAKWTDMRDWRRVRAFSLNRTVLWRTQTPTEIIPGTETVGLVEDFLQVDPAIQQLEDVTQHDLIVCLQISRYLFAHLRYLNAETSLAHIRSSVADLQRYVSMLLQNDQHTGLWRRVPRLMFYIVFTGAFASRGFRDERHWFARKISAGIVLQTPTSYDDMKNILGMFLDPSSVHEILLKEVWDDILARQ